MDWNRLLSRTRLGLARPHPDSEARTDFQRDFDRIVFSSAFRRLQDKTQVFPLSQSDYVRTRLTHSLEVSSVGRSLGTMVGDSVIKRHDLKGVYPQDFGAVVAAASLAHDIGNPPFGHAGEDAIRLWFTASATGRAVLAQLSESQQQDFLRFEGNAQGFRIITRLQSPDNRGGMQLTCATLGTFTKYPRAAWLSTEPLPGIAFKKFGFYRDDGDLFAEVAAQLGLEPVQPGAWSRHPLAYLVEAADDICYLIIDMEDAHKRGIITTDDVERCFLSFFNQDTDSAFFNHKDEIYSVVTDLNERISFIGSMLINKLVRCVSGIFVENYGAIMEGNFKESLISHLPDFEKRALDDCRSESTNRIYRHPSVVKIELTGVNIIGTLLDDFVDAILNPQVIYNKKLLSLIPVQFKTESNDMYSKVQSVTDFISNMTDLYAVQFYKDLHGIN